MIVTDAAAFLAAVRSGQLPPPRSAASARAAFLVAPAGDSLALESAQDNRYMDLAQTLQPERALRQHAELARRLGDEVPTLTFPGDPTCPDGLFPNNVFATARGRLIVGRMRHPVRQRETARADIRGFFRDLLGYSIVDLSQDPLVAELTGALVIDRARGIGYCGLSERCDLAGARAMHAAFGLALTFCFELAAGEYHTNVVFALLDGRVALLAADGFRDPAVPAAIAQVYAGGAIWIDPAQKQAFAANAIALTPQRAWISARGAASLRPAQLSALERHGFALADVELDEIEKAGGSLRCCVAEIF
jgi:hypothetical protein